ncbi:MAG TPA: NRDE family protein [Steroidobacteraceae bacterium]
MCLILTAWQVHRNFPTVIAANRDEFHERPSEAARFWPEAPQILAGRDLLAGGTWLGMSRQGRFAALTNYRGAARRETAPSRGLLVKEILESAQPIESTLEHLRKVGPGYAGFNVIFSDGRRLAIFESTVNDGRELPPGIYGLSNHLLDTPWPKVSQAKSALGAALLELPATDQVLALLRDDRPAPEHELPRTGVSEAWEKLLSSAFIRGDPYGTRCSTVITVDADGQAQFEEWSWGRTGEERSRVRFEFKVET